MSDMQNAPSTGSSDLTEVTAMSAGELAVSCVRRLEKIAALEHQLEWFRRQLFGQKSERFAPEPDPSQMHLGEVFPAPAQPIDKHQSIPAHTRRITQTDGAESGEELKFFDESKVPVQTITLVHCRRRGALTRPVRGHRREGDLPDCPASGELSDPQVPPAGGQNQEHRADPRPAGTPRGFWRAAARM